MEFLSYLITGISLGSIYAIIALGYTMVYGIAKMLNFAHGDVIMVGAYVSFYVTMFAGSNLLGEDPSALTTGAVALVSVLLAMVVCTVLGVVIEGLAYRPLRQAGSLAVLITAIGVSYFLQNAAQLLFGANPKNFTPVVSGQLTLFDGQLRISYVALLTITACVVIMLALTAFTGRTKMGKAMRAVSEDKGAAQLMGINVNRTISMTFAIGSGLAAVLRLSHPHPHHRLHAGHQGIYCRCVRRDRLHPRGPAGRPAAGCHRDLCRGLYLHPVVHGGGVRRTDRGAAGEARRSAGQDCARESVRW